MKTIRKHPRPGIKLALIALVVLVMVGLGFLELNRRVEGQWHRPGEWWGAKATTYHYADEVKEWSDRYDLSFAYLMALIQLESGGRKPAGSRFEPHVYKRLQDVKSGRKQQYEQVTTEDLQDASDEAIRNLSTSWGPFQLMGYKCIQLDVQIRDIRGKDAIRAGVEWIDQTYGHEIRKGNFRNAFHLHNTGKHLPEQGPPLTYHPDYIEKGMRYMNAYLIDEETP